MSAECTDHIIQYQIHILRDDVSSRIDSCEEQHVLTFRLFAVLQHTHLYHSVPSKEISCNVYYFVS